MEVSLDRAKFLPATMPRELRRTASAARVSCDVPADWTAGPESATRILADPAGCRPGWRCLFRCGGVRLTRPNGTASSLARRAGSGAGRRPSRSTSCSRRARRSVRAVFATKPGHRCRRSRAPSAWWSGSRCSPDGPADEQAAEVAARLRPVSAGWTATSRTSPRRSPAQGPRLGAPYSFSVQPSTHGKSPRASCPDRAGRAAGVVACKPTSRGSSAAAACCPPAPWLDLDCFRPPRLRRPSLRLLAVGRLVPKKGFPALLDAAAATPRLRSPADRRRRPPPRGARAQIAEDLGIGRPRAARGPRLRTRSCRPSSPPRTSSSCRRSGREGRPRRPAQRRPRGDACGRPVIASDVAGVRRRRRRRASPASSSRRATCGAAGAHRVGLADPARASALGREARAKVEADFELHSCTARLRAFLESVYA